MSMTVGVLGGMGPEATADFFIKLIRRTPATRDSDHLHVIIDSDPQVPDRTAFILGRGPSPVPALVATARDLVRAGAQLIAIPCITAHHFIEEIRTAVSVPVLNAVELTARHVEKRFAAGDPLAVLSTTGTLRMGIFQRAMPGRTLILPTDDEQRDIIMEAIYGPAGVKAAGVVDGTRTRIEEYVRTLAGRGAKAVVAGCTEFSVLLNDADLVVPLVDPMWLLAEEVVGRAREERSKVKG